MITHLPPLLCVYRGNLVPLTSLARGLNSSDVLIHFIPTTFCQAEGRLIRYRIRQSVQQPVFSQDVSQRSLPRLFGVQALRR